MSAGPHELDSSESSALGWPVVRGGYFASDTEQPGPAAQEGQGSDYELQVKPLDQPGGMGNSST